jgi:arsenate reductase
MAEGFAKKLAGDDIEVFSAGSLPSGRVNPHAIAVMKEIGIDVSSQRSNGFYDLPYKEFDYVITMGCKDTCPFVPSKKTIDWDIEAPTGDDLNRFRKIRDDVKSRVEKLMKKI